MVTGGFISNPINVDMQNFTDEIEVKGIYNLCEYAIKQNRPIILTGMKYGNLLISAVAVSPEKLDDGTIKIMGFGAIVTEDDKLQPLPEEPAEEEENVT